MRRGWPPPEGGARAAASASSNKAGVFAKRGREALGRRLAPFVHELVNCSNPCAPPASLRARATAAANRGAMLDRGSRARTRRPQGRARGASALRDIARERLRRLPVGLADAADRGMRVPVIGGFARRGERAIEIVERGKRDGAKDRKLERARRRFDLAGERPKRTDGMRKEREERARRERDRRFKDEPRQRAGRALPQACVRPNLRPRRPIAQARPRRGARSTGRA